MSESRRWVKRLREIRGRPSCSAPGRWAAVEQLAQDEGRPPLGEDLRATRHRAELAVVGHPESERLASTVRKFTFWSFAGRRLRRWFHWAGRPMGGNTMRQLAPFAVALLLVTCGGAAPRAESTATPP